MCSLTVVGSLVIHYKYNNCTPQYRHAFENALMVSKYYCKRNNVPYVSDMIYEILNNVFKCHTLM